MTSPALRALRWSFLGGLALAALSASSVVAWHFGWARQLGPPLLWHVYAPAAALRWAWWWWGDPAWRGEFLSALIDVAVVAVVPVGIVRLLELQGRLPVDLGDAAAGLGSPRDLLATGQVAAHGDGVVLGAAGRRLLRDVGEGHVLAVGPPRSGKTAGIAIPTLLTYRGSALVYDPKGEMAVVAGRFRAALGPVFVLDPTSRDTARFNPLLEIREGDNLVADCQVAAEVLARSGAAGGDNPFWNDSASHLLTALLVHVRTSGEPTLAHLSRLVEGLDAERYPRAAHPHAARLLAAHRGTDAKLRGSINRTVSVGLRVLADPMLQRLTAASDFRASDLQAAAAPVSVFLTVRPSHAVRLRPFTRLLVQSLAFALLEEVGRTADGRAKRRGTLLLLDEFPQLGALDVIETTLPICAGYGVRALLLCQDKAQIERFYGRDESVTGIVGTACVIPGFNERSVDSFRRLAGEHRVRRESRQRPLGFGGQASRSESVAVEPVLNNLDMIARARDEVLVFTFGCRPTYVGKSLYFARRELRGLFDDKDGPRLVGTGAAPGPELPAGPESPADAEPDEHTLVIALPPDLFRRLEAAAGDEGVDAFVLGTLADFLRDEDGHEERAGGGSGG